MAEFPSKTRLFNPDPAWTAAQAHPDFVSWFDVTTQLFGAQEPQALTIATGQITPTRSAVIVDTEGAAPADDLTTIVATGLHDGAVVVLTAANASRVVTVKHSAAAGGISLVGGVDAALTASDWLVLRRAGDRWVEMRWQRAGTATTATDLALGRVLAISKGGTGATDAAGARAALSVPTRDLGDVSQIGTTKIANMAMPSGRYVAIPPFENNITKTYIAISDGYLYMSGTSSGTGGIVYISSSIYSSSVTSLANTGVYITIPVVKGVSYQYASAGMQASDIARFIYANGAY